MSAGAAATSRRALGTLEPGLLPVLRLYVTVSAGLVPVFMRMVGVTMGVVLPWDHHLLLIVPVHLAIVGYTWAPWWRRRLGPAFLPAGLSLIAAYSLAEKYLTVQFVAPPQWREMLTLLFMLRLWVAFQFILLFVAWQYDLRWVIGGALALCLLDSALGLPFMDRQGVLFPLYLVISATRLVAVTGVGLALGLLMQRQRQQRASLAAANRQLALQAVAMEQLAASQERNRLARELHDTLAHSLSGVTVQLEAVEALWDVNATAAHRMVDQALAATRNGLTEARRALHALRASPLDDLGLPLAVSDLAESVAARAGLVLDLDVETHLAKLPPDVEQCLYRVAQEALTNVARHAQARALRIALVQNDGHVLLTVADDGRGFDVAGVNGAHYGLKGLRERAEMMGATLHVLSAVQRGTTVRFEIPVAGATFAPATAPAAATAATAAANGRAP